MATIPASNIVRVTPSTLAAGGTALDMNGVILTNSTRVPFGQVYSFTSGLTVANFFGPTALETTLANSYFLGFNNSNTKPGVLMFMQYASGAVAAYMRSGPVSAIPLATLQAMTGALTIVVDGVSKTTASINLSLATSYSSAASIISAALLLLGANPPVCTYDSVSGSFLIYSPTVGAASTMSVGSGALAPLLNMTTATGAIVSQGAAADTPAAAMTRLISVTTNWATFMTAFEPVQADKLAFAAWTNSQNDDYAYICWDTDITATQANNATSMGVLVKNSQYSGTFMVYQDVAVAAMALGSIASIDFTELNGRTTLAFRGQSGLTPTVTDAITSINLIKNGYNYYGAYATANEQFNFLYPGAISGPFAWADSYINEIWMSNQFQLALVVLLTSVKSIPYNDQGYAMIKAACLDVILQALAFGAIRPNVPLSQSQASQVNANAGLLIDGILSQKGWYMQVSPALPQVRAARGSPPCTFWYMDGQSVQAINLASVQLQ